MTTHSGDEPGNHTGLFEEGNRQPSPPGRPEGIVASLVKLLVPLLVPLAFMLFTVPTAFILEGPGPAFDLQEDLSVEGAQTYPSQGEMLLTSVSLEESRLIYNLLALFDDSIELMKVQDYLGEELNAEEQETVDIVITFLSEDTAVVVGLQETGIPVEITKLGLFVIGVVPDYPVDGLIDPGEVIVGINGEAVENMDQFAALIGSTPEGESVTLQVKEINAELAQEASDAVEEGLQERPDLVGLLEEGVREVQVQPVYDPELGRNVIGTSLREYFAYSSGVEVGWDLATVKGPSAGMMMTLSLVNALTPDDLTAGEAVAGTGEIMLNGDVGPIGGLPFKIQAAEMEGAEIFIYPIENQEDLAGFSTALKLYAVDTLDEAMEVLRSLE